MKEQRDQLYRKLDLLKAQGIEIMGPNMSVLKTEPVQQSQQQGEVLFYSSEAVGTAASAAPGVHQSGRTISPTTANHNASLRKASGVPPQGGGGAMKDGGGVVGNLNLLSTTNEAKGDKPEIKQQIPVKLSSKLSVSGGSAKDKGSKKISSVVGLTKVRTALAAFFNVIFSIRSL